MRSFAVSLYALALLNVAFGAPTPADRFDVCRRDGGSQQDGGDMTSDCHGAGSDRFDDRSEEFQSGDGPDDGGLGGERDRKSFDGFPEYAGQLAPREYGGRMFDGPRYGEHMYDGPKYGEHMYDGPLYGYRKHGNQHYGKEHYGGEQFGDKAGHRKNSFVERPLDHGSKQLAPRDADGYYYSGDNVYDRPSDYYRYTHTDSSSSSPQSTTVSSTGQQSSTTTGQTTANNQQDMNNLLGLTAPGGLLNNGLLNGNGLGTNSQNGPLLGGLGLGGLAGRPPTTNAPTGNTPTGNVPTGNAPTGNTPTANQPTRNTPITNQPVGNAPGTFTPPGAFPGRAN